VMGPGGHYKYEFPDKESCYEALEHMRVAGAEQRAGEDDEQVVAYCVPKD